MLDHDTDPAGRDKGPSLGEVFQVLLATMDGSMAAETGSEAAGGHRHVAGLAAAERLTMLLVRHRLAWHDMITRDDMLVKICGRLGSEYAAEREAAYGHAVRHLKRRGTTWSTIASVPSSLQTRLRASAPKTIQVPSDWPPEAVTAPASRPRHAPPDGDWITTVHNLISRRAWRSDREHEWMQVLELELVSGQEMQEDNAARLRELWWHAELNLPRDDGGTR